MDQTQKQTPKCPSPVKKTFTNIFGATVDNTVHNINYNGTLSTSRKTSSMLKDFVTIALIIGAFVIAWRVYILCRNKKNKSDNTTKGEKRTEQHRIICMNKTQQTDQIPSDPLLQQTHTIQIE
jgi:hypothetical protein